MTFYHMTIARNENCCLKAAQLRSMNAELVKIFRKSIKGMVVLT